jgi:hypothetical protein
MPEESLDAEVRQDSGELRGENKVFFVVGFLGRDGAIMDQGLPVIEIVLEAMNKISQFHFMITLGTRNSLPLKAQTSVWFLGYNVGTKLQRHKGTK